MLTKLSQADQLRVGALFLERSIHYRSNKKKSDSKKWKFSADEVGTAIFAFYKVAASVRKSAYIKRLREASPCYFCVNFNEPVDDRLPICTQKHNMEEDAIDVRGGLGCLDYERGPSYDKTFVERELGKIEAFWSQEKVLHGIIDLADRLKFLAKQELIKEKEKSDDLISNAEGL